MGDLVHDEVAILEVAEQSVVDFDADVVLVLLQTETAEEEVLHPMIVQLGDDGFLGLGEWVRCPRSG